MKEDIVYSKHKGSKYPKWKVNAIANAGTRLLQTNRTSVRGGDKRLPHRTNLLREQLERKASNRRRTTSSDNDDPQSE